MRTTYGSPLFADHVPTHDSLLVERLRAAGAVIIGKTNTPEFGAGSQTFNAVFGATRNPHDLTKTPGGSSGGAAAAVAAGMLPFADGSDLGASVRNPAAFCNLVGLRPSPGRIPGPRARATRGTRCPCSGRSPATPRDVALLFRALAGPDPRDPLSIHEPWPIPDLSVDPRGLRIAWSRDRRRAAGRARGHRGARAARGRRWRRSAASSRTPSPTSSGADECFEVLRGVDVRRRVRGDRPTRSSRRWRENVRFGLVADAGADRARARPARRAVHAHARVPARYDVLAAPVTQVAPFASTSSTRREIAGRRDGLLPRVVPLLQPDHGHLAPGARRAGRASRPTGCRSGCSSSAATAARPTCCGSRTPSPRRPGSRRAPEL